MVARLTARRCVGGGRGGDNRGFSRSALVEPDAFYERFFAALLEGGRSERGRALIERALDAARGSHFLIHARRYALPVERERPPPP